MSATAPALDPTLAAWQEAVGPRYAVEAVLGAGATGVVLRAHDRERGEAVAVKVVVDEALDAASVREEFRVAARLDHQHIPRIHDHGVSPGGRPWLAMELVDGEPFDAFARAAAPAAVLEALRQALSALEHLHRHGLVHGDVKDGNLLVERGGARATRLLDFGLARSVASGGEVALSGTAAFLAPELALGHPRDIRADLYALGVVAYAALTGANPFHAPTPAECIERHVGLVPPPVHKVAPAIAASVGAFVDRLLHKDPARRYQTPGEALAALAELTDTEALGATAAAACHVMRPPLVGRAGELDLLDRALASLDGRQGGLVAIVGDAGAGKSRLCEEARRRARGAGLDCGLATCLAGEGSLEPLWRALAAFHGTAALARGRLDARTPDGLVDAARVAAGIAADAGDAPRVLILDDLHAASWELLSVVVALAHQVRAARLLVVAAWTPPAGRGAAIERVESVFVGTEIEGLGRRLDLGRLAPTETHALVEAAVGGAVDPETVSAPLHQASGGNPLLVLELLRHVAGAGRLTRRGGRWVPGSGQGLFAGPHRLKGSAVEAILEARYDGLSEEERRVLDGLVVLGRPASARCLARALDAAEGGLEAGLAALVDAELLRVVSEGPPRVYDVAQKAFRGVVEARTDEAWRQALHRRTAAALEAEPGAIPEREALLAHHHGLAGERDAALAWGLAAAAAAEDAGDLGQAVRQYGRLRELLDGDHRHPAWWPFHEKLGAHLRRLGLYEEALEALEAAASAPGDAPEAAAGRARLLRQLVEVLARLGRVAQAREVLGTLQAGPGGDGGAAPPADPTEAASLEAAAAETLRLGGAWDEARARAVAGLAVAGADPSARMRLLREVATLDWHQGRLEDAAGHARQALLLARGAGDRPAEADAQQVLGTVHRHASRLEEAVRAYVRAIEVYERFGLLAALGKAHNNVAVCHWLAGRWDAAAEHWSEAIRASELSHEVAEKLVLLNNLGFLHTQRGLYGRAERAFTEGFTLAERAGAARMQPILHGNYGEACYYQGRYDEARMHFRRAIEVAERIGSRGDAVENRRRMAELALDEGDPDEAAALADDALAEARALSLRGEIAALCRVVGEAELAAGRVERGRSRLAEATAALGDDEESLDAARLQVALAALDERLGDLASARARLGKAAATCEGLGAVWHTERARAALDALAPRVAEDPARHADAQQLATVFATLHALADEQDLPKAARRLLDAVLEVTRAERGVVYVAPTHDIDELRVARLAGRSVTGAWSGQADAFSGTVARQVLETGRPVSVVNVQDNATLASAASVVAMDLRSVMAVPIPIDGAAGGVVYVDSRVFVGERFGASVPVVHGMAATFGLAVERARWKRRYASQVETVAMIAHEVNSPLNAILGFAHLAEHDIPRQEQPEALRDLLEIVDSQGHRIASILQDSRKLWQLTDLDLATSMRPLAAADLLDDIVRTLAPAAREAGVVLSFDVAPGVRLVRVDRERVQQVFFNLVNNAIRFSPPGGTIRLAAAPQPAEELIGTRRFVRFTVSDEGPGVPAEDRDRIFQRFNRGSRSRGEGTGLGLNVAAILVRAHGGAIWVDGERGPGGHFSFTLPEQEEAAP